MARVEPERSCSQRIGSTLVGSGLRFGRGADEYWFDVLRSLQYKLSSYSRFELLVENAGY